MAKKLKYVKLTVYSTWNYKGFVRYSNQYRELRFLVAKNVENDPESKVLKYDVLYAIRQQFKSNYQFNREKRMIIVSASRNVTLSSRSYRIYTEHYFLGKYSSPEIL